jgi:hypothetical protein
VIPVVQEAVIRQQTLMRLSQNSMQDHHASAQTLNGLAVRQDVDVATATERRAQFGPLPV